MALPAARGLFHRVWTMSGQQLTGRTREHATADARAELEALGLTPQTIAELKTLPMERIAAIANRGSWNPVVDGSGLPRDPFAPDAALRSAAPRRKRSPRAERRLFAPIVYVQPGT